MKQELKAMSQSEAQSKKSASFTATTKKEPLSFVEQMKKEYLKKGKVTKGKAPKKEDDILKKMTSFSSLIKSTAKSKPKSNATVKAKREDEEKECALHFVVGCQSCKDTFGNQVDDDDDDGWMNAKLKFKKAVGANVFEPKVDDYTVVDPRAATSDKASDIFGRNAKAGNGAWKDRSLLKK
jgi:peptidyl-prolyl cis-trans isomerase SDCCAG10